MAAIRLFADLAHIPLPPLLRWAKPSLAAFTSAAALFLEPAVGTAAAPTVGVFTASALGAWAVWACGVFVAAGIGGLISSGVIVAGAAVAFPAFAGLVPAFVFVALAASALWAIMLRILP
eukprot:1559061-Prymnesium_polylepis.1